METAVEGKIVQIKVKKEEPKVYIENDIKSALEARFGKNHPLVEVARCESGYRQFNKDGAPLVNPSPHSSATGIFQILQKTHGPTAERMGMDIRTLEGNMDYAEYLYNRNGLRDWEESRPCWG